jgi:predicted nucleic acid-binding protein
LAVLNRWPAAGVELCLSGQVVREYLVVATRPIDVNGLGLRLSQARDNVEAMVGRARVLDETRDVMEQLFGLLRTNRMAGKRIHDANIVATAIAHGVTKVVTDNSRHFRGFKEIEALGLAAVTQAEA